jgi:hypothetical protein
VEVVHHCPLSGGTVFFQVQSVFAGGTLDIDTDGSIGTLSFGSHDVTFKNSFILRMKIDGSRQGFGDQILIGGANQLIIDNGGTTHPSLVINTLHASPAHGWVYDIIVAPVEVGAFDPANVSFIGIPETYVLSYPRGNPMGVRLTAN